jgi:hypothetical protein
LVEFDRRDLPIYATPESQWADAGRDAAVYGAPLDRLFGEPGEVFVSAELMAQQMTAPAMPAIDDPVVELSGLNDGLILPAMEHEPAHADGALHLPEIATVYDFTDGGLHLHDLWTFDSHA